MWASRVGQKAYSGSQASLRAHYVGCSLNIARHMGGRSLGEEGHADQRRERLQVISSGTVAPPLPCLDLQQ